MMMTPNDPNMFNALPQAALNKKQMIGKEQQQGANPAALLAHHDGDDMSSEDDQQHLMVGGDKKPRIPWDRNVRGDKNGLKLALLTCVYENNFHVEGRFMENFRKVSQILSQEGSKFEKYHGIEPSGAQRKFNSVIKEVAKTYRMNDNGEFLESDDTDGFEKLALKMLKDMIAKEKSKRLSRANKRPSEAMDDPNDDNDGLQFLLKKRNSDMISLKNTMRKAATVGVEGEEQFSGVDAGSSSTSVPIVSNGAPGANRGAKIHRLDSAKHLRVLQLLRERNPPIITVGELFMAAEVSEAGTINFFNHTGIKLEKPVERILKLYEEVAAEKDFVNKMKQLTGLNAGDVLELEALLRPLYQ